MGIFSKKSKNPPSRRSEKSTSDISDNPTTADSFRRNANYKRYSHIHNNESSRINHHQLLNKRKKLSIILLVTLVIIGLLFFLISQFTADVSIVINNSLTTDIDKTKYQNIIQDYLKANPLSRLRFVLDNKKLDNYIVSNISEVENVVQKTISGFGKTDFEVNLRKPVASWKIDDKQYYVDSKGVAFEINYFDEPLVKVVDNSGAYIESGLASISRRFLSFVGRVVSLSNESGYSVKEAILPEDTTRQLNVILSDSDILVKMTIDRAVADQVDDMSRAVEHFSRNGRKPKYIDVRVDDKVFFIE